MKTKITFLLILLMGLSFGFAQQDEECMTKLSIFHEYVKAKNYDAAYEPWSAVRNKCPKFNNAIYVDGEKILDHKIETSSGTEKLGYINDLLKLYEQRLENFPNKTPRGKYGTMACQLMYDYRKELNKTPEELYECFDAVYNADKENFTNPKSLYTYFSLMVELFDAKKKPAQDLFNKYDDIVDKVEDEVKIYSAKLNILVAKEDEGSALSKKQESYKRYYESYLKAYDQISSGIDGQLGPRANCDNLIPLYTKDFEANKNDAVWLKRAVSRMFYKECTDDPLYEKMVKAYDETAPSADTKYFVATVLLKNGKENEAVNYFTESYELEEDSFKKAKLANNIGLILKKKGRYGQARTYFRNALKLNPSNGRPHLSIAAMYAASANDCGTDNFTKRAVYWYAAEEAKKAARVDPTQRSNSSKSVANYLAKAPSKSEIFSKGNSGEVIKIGCWIGGSVTVPDIK
ncbi:tetratricopeptide repeat protein [Seonamhaeicola sediminis]|uniref:Tetratricopeptide repeat protein n=1 Tax=Seonamhaeicola sediminis TaxID=2528206 RepID=A0A562YF82_9FLAO|nr:tetratricopeptide repeat protein [Seonamhaeicola sediminis]TWO33317.1 tetratricopeptide repeat protein [Seonamhaeicola sediminis]